MQDRVTNQADTPSPNQEQKDSGTTEPDTTVSSRDIADNAGSREREGQMNWNIQRQVSESVTRTDCEEGVDANRLAETDRTMPSSRSPCSSLQISDVVDDKYEIVREIGAGGMGVVYEVKRCRLSREPLALKTLLHVNPSSDAALRFQREARILIDLNHPNVVKTHGFGISKDGRVYLVMDLIKGQSLTEEIKRIASFPDPNKIQAINFAVEVAIQVCDGLTHVHERQHLRRTTTKSNHELKPIVHRDLKPSNIMISWVPTNQGADASVKPHATILDFGIAKIYDDDKLQSLTESGTGCGTAAYMSPEQCRSAKLDPRSDIYALGCILFECITGIPPYVGRGAEIMIKHCSEPIPSFTEATLGAAIPNELERIVHKTLEKDPNDRYQTAEALKYDLLAFQNGRSSSTKTGAPVVSKVKKPGARDSQSGNPRIKSMLITLSAIALLLIVFCAFAVGRHDRGEKTRISEQIKSKNHSSTGATSAISADIASLQMTGTDVEQLLRIAPKTNYDRTIRQLVISDRKISANYEGTDLTDAGLGYLCAANSKMEELNLAHTKISDAGLKLLSGRRLQSLRLAGDSISDAGLANLSSAKIRNLDLSETGITDLGIASIAANRIVNLDLSHTKITNQGLVSIGKMPRLEKLSLAYDNDVSDKGLPSLARLALIGLDLRGTKITDAGIPYISRIRTLKTLNLNSTAVSDQCLKTMETLDSLSFLALAHDHISDKCIDQLRNLRNLLGVDLRYTDVTDRGVHQLSSCAVQIRQLYLSGTAVTNEALRFLEELRSLEIIDLAGTQITDRGLRSLASHNRLFYLSLSHTRITDAGLLFAVIHLPNLSELDVSETSVTNKGINEIAGLKKLAVLDIRNTKVRGQAILDLMRCRSLKEVAVLDSQVDSVTQAALSSNGGLRLVKTLSPDHPDF